MLRTTKARLASRRQEQSEGGFTLIELMVVVLIIAILLAIAVPTFLGAQNKAKDRSAQSSLRNAATAAKTVYADKQAYTDASNTNMPSLEPSLTYQPTGTASDDPKEVSVDVSDAQAWYGAAWSKAGSCFFIKDSNTTGTQFAKGTTTQSECTGSKAKAATTYTSAGW